MTTYHVKSDGSATAPYETWAKAHTTLSALLAAVTIAAGDKIRIHSGHVENNGASWNITFASSRTDPVEIMSCNTDDEYEPGATLQATGGLYDLSLLEGGHIYGITFEAGDDFRLVDSSVTWYFFECTFNIDGHIDVPGGGESIISFINCDFDTGETTIFDWDALDVAAFDVIGCRFNCTSGVQLFSPGTGWDNQKFRVLNSDLTGCTSMTRISGNTSSGALNCHGRVENCALPSGCESMFPSSGDMVFSGTGSDFIMSGCGDLWQLEHVTDTGRLVATDDVYRVGGASDGASNYCWKLVTNSYCTRNYFRELPEIVRVVEAERQKITLYVGSTSTLANDEFWIEVTSPSEAITGSNAKLRSTRTYPPSAGVTLSQDNDSLWQGATLNQYKVDFYISPQVAGLVTLRCFLATNATVYVDPV